MITTFPNHLEKDNDSIVSIDDVTVRRASPGDAEALQRLADLEGREAGAQPHLLADHEGTVIASLSLVDGIALGDPFRPTADVVDLLSAHAERLGDSPRGRHGARRGRRVIAGVTATIAMVALLGTTMLASAAAAPKPGFVPGTWVGTGTIGGTAVDSPMTTRFNGGISFTLRVDAGQRVTGTGTWRLGMLGAETTGSEGAMTSRLKGSAAIAFTGSGTKVVFKGTQRVAGAVTAYGVTRAISFTRPLTGTLRITRAGMCRMSGGTTLAGGVALRWSAVLKGSGTCRT